MPTGRHRERQVNAEAVADSERSACQIVKSTKLEGMNQGIEHGIGF
ncbi:hypothetical protein ACPOL_1225 [Acidisarcina polymorpha]|uniref:Uncharacterized protein n=1 Tax=Acidisarcina polymorpha TaxID=2211140 RepID=A0A2Z5FUM3_9BACT|nr:hypothetical protein ACPOL_1225 [Acidisarcina polymorpha]